VALVAEKPKFLRIFPSREKLSTTELEREKKYDEAVIIHVVKEQEKAWANMPPLPPGPFKGTQPVLRIRRDRERERELVRVLFIEAAGSRAAALINKLEALDGPIQSPSAATYPRLAQWASRGPSGPSTRINAKKIRKLLGRITYRGPTPPPRDKCGSRHSAFLL
jgi:hypothetical protein